MPTRLAAAQFASGTDVAANLETCLRMLARAAEVRPNLTVLPEFCNRLSWYADQSDVWESAVEEDGPFLRAIADAARTHAMHVVINCSVRRTGGAVTVTSLLFDPAGRCVLSADKQTLMGHENFRFARGAQPAPVADTALGRVGLYACRDGVTMETPRALAVQGAQLLCNSLNSFAFDEADLHVPVRAPENKVFVVAANKVGPLIPEHLLDAAAARLGVPARYLYGAGESQIVAPDGTVLAKAPRSGEAVVWADVDLALAHDKRRPDGTDVLANRRGALYRPIASPPTPPDDHPAAAQITAAVYQPTADGPAAVDEVCALLRQHADLDLLVLPALFDCPGGVVADPAAAAAQVPATLRRLIATCPARTVICTSLVERDGAALYHTGYLVGSAGVLHRQRQTHRSARHPWAALGDDLTTVDLPWGRLGVIVGDDSLYPEVAKVLAIAGADVLAVPLHAQEAWETRLGLVDRSAENRVCLVAATRPSPVGSSLIVTQWADFQIFTPWQERPFNGTINEPIVTRAPTAPGLTIAPIHPATARHKTMSAATDLLQHRAWHLADILCTPHAARNT